MCVLKSTGLCLLLSFGTVVLSSPDAQLQSLHRRDASSTTLVGLRRTAELQKRCTGDCVTCFGSGYQECASDSSVCYKPGDAVHGEESCSGSSWNIPSTPTFDFCSEGGCETCFGEGFQYCPGSTFSCYKPGDSTYGLESACSSSSDTSSGTDSSTFATSATGSSSEPTSSPSSSDGTNITSTDFCSNGGFDCGRCFGSTYIPCPESSSYASDSYCYDPNNSTSVCPDGAQPPAGSGSTGSGSGNGSGSGSDSSSGSGSGSESASYTAFTPSGTSSTAASVASGISTSETTAAIGGGTSGSGSGSNSAASDTDVSSSATSASSRTFSASSGSQTSSSSDSNGDPVSASTSGQSSVRESVFGILAASAMCFAAGAWFAV